MFNDIFNNSVIFSSFSFIISAVSYSGTDSITVRCVKNGKSGYASSELVTPEAAAEGAIAVLKKIREYCPESKIVVMAVFPRGPRRDFFDPRINPLNAAVKAFTEQQENMQFLDISEKFLNEDGSQNLAFYADAGCHPNNAGYQLWAEALLLIWISSSW